MDKSQRGESEREKKKKKGFVLDAKKFNGRGQYRTLPYDIWEFFFSGFSRIWIYCPDALAMIHYQVLELLCLGTAAE